VTSIENPNRSSMKITVMENGPNKLELEGTSYRVLRDGQEETMRKP
jgi:hypothetical protein